MRSFPFKVKLGLLGAMTAGFFGSACVEQEEEQLTPQDLELVKQHLLSAAPTPKVPVNADLDGKVIYLGIDVEPAEVEVNKDIKLTHYWKVITPPGAGWRLFTHLNGPKLQGFINVDHGPVLNKYPVSQWKAGDIIRDEQVIRLPATWAHDSVEVYTGIWKGAQRLEVKSGPHDNVNRVLAATIKVKGKAPPEEKKYLARKVKTAPKIDGDLSDEAWKGIASTGVFVNTMTGEPMGKRSEAKITWDDKFLYFGFDNQDTDVWGDMASRDDKLWQQEAVEIMIDANRDGRGYIELQVSPRGTVFDCYLPEYRKYEDSIDPKAKPYSWNGKWKSAVKVDGTFNKRDDEDKSWSVEIAVPWGDINGLGTEAPLKAPPALGTLLKLNMFRLDQPKTGAQEAHGWSPPLAPDFHKLDRFGSVLLADAAGLIAAAPAALAPAAAAGTGEAAGGKSGTVVDPTRRKEAIREALRDVVAPPGKGGQELKIDSPKVAPATPAP